MIQNVAEFVKQMAEDPILRTEFAKHREATGDSVDVVAATLGRERGIGFEPSDCQLYADQLSARIKAGEELSDAELELVSGGFMFDLLVRPMVNIMKEGMRVAVGKIANGCFLTTACCEAKGLPDDCPELQAFRHLRDNYVLHRPDGAALVESYCLVAPHIVKAIKSSPDADQTLAQMYANLVVPNVRHIQQGEFEAAYLSAIAQYQVLLLRYLA